MSQLTTPMPHRVVACVNGLEELLDQVAELDPGYLSTPDKADVLVRLSRLVDRVEGLRLRVMASAMDVADVEGAPTVAAWLAPRTRATAQSLHGRELLARGLERRWQHVGAGVADGRVSLAQAEVIVRALEALDAPAASADGERVDRELLAKAEQHLVEKAADFTPQPCAPSGSGSSRSSAPSSTTTPSGRRCWPPNDAPPRPPGSPCTPAATGPSTSVPGSPRPPPPACRPTWKRSPHPAAPPRTARRRQ